MLFQYSSQAQPQQPAYHPASGQSLTPPPVKRHEWWRAALIIVGAVVAVVLIVVTIITLGVRSMQTSQHDDMYQIVHSKEADKAFREDLNMDPLAFTDKGVIHSYVIDDASISHNPMGGINVVLYVNGDKELDESVTLDRYSADGPLEVGPSSSSVKLYDLIGLNNQRYGVTSPLYPDDIAKEYAEQLKKLNQSGNEQTEDKSERNGDGDE